MGGNKQTEVGVIPADWRITPLGKLIRSVEYGSSAKSNMRGRVPVLRMGNLQGGKLVWDDLVYTDDEAEIGKYTLRSGDVLFNRTNTIELVGKTSLYAGERPAIFAGYLIRINPDDSLLDSRFLNFILNTDFTRRHSAKILSVAVGQANINGQKLKTYPIPLPPTKAEQEAIAEALSDADALIESLEQLLAKKRHLKQAAMQELLRPRDEWTTESIGTLFQLTAGRPKSSALNDSGKFVVMDMGSVSSEGKTLASKRTDLVEDVLRCGDLVMPKDDIGGGKIIGRVAFIGRDDAYVLGDHVYRLRAIDVRVSAQFFYFLINSQYVSQDLKKKVAGSAQLGLSRAAVLEQPVRFPSEHAAQADIVRVLSDMDTEIAALDAKLTKARYLKSGMMQELLTGRTRLVSTRPAVSGEDVVARQ